MPFVKKGCRRCGAPYVIFEEEFGVVYSGLCVACETEMTLPANRLLPEIWAEECDGPDLRESPRDFPP
jgi:hypothetical protein